MGRRKKKSTHGHQTSVRLADEDRRAVASIQQWVHSTSGAEISEAAAIRLALREFAKGLK